MTTPSIENFARKIKKPPLQFDNCDESRKRKLPPPGLVEAITTSGCRISVPVVKTPTLSAASRKSLPPGCVEIITAGGCRIAVPAAKTTASSSTNRQNLVKEKLPIPTLQDDSLSFIVKPIACSTPKVKSLPKPNVYVTKTLNEPKISSTKKNSNNTAKVNQKSAADVPIAAKIPKRAESKKHTNKTHSVISWLKSQDAIPKEIDNSEPKEVDKFINYMPVITPQDHLKPNLKMKSTKDSNNVLDNSVLSNSDTNFNLNTEFTTSSTSCSSTPPPKNTSNESLDAATTSSGFYTQSFENLTSTLCSQTTTLSEKTQTSKLFTNTQELNSEITLDNVSTNVTHVENEVALTFVATDDDSISTENSEVASNLNLLNQIKNEPLPDKNDLISGLHNVNRPRYTDSQTFFEQKKRTRNKLEHVFETLKNAPAETELATDPEGLLVPLMTHQKHALVWLQYCEKRFPFGGILADDMGLGKTLSMLSLVMAEKIRLKNGENVDMDIGVAPDGGTLVVCPPALLKQWESEVNKKFNFTLIPLIFHGQVTKLDIKNLKKFDIVITTYDSLLNGRLARYIYKVYWRRIILDEAHIVRNPATQRSECVCSLKAKYRWALTGTPIHNKETDLFSILKFLKYAPFDEKAFWNIWLSNHQRLGVVMRSIMLRRTKIELQNQNAMFKLPERTEKLLELKLSEDEMKVHQAVLSFSKTLVRKYIEQCEARKNNLNPCIVHVTAVNENNFEQLTTTERDYIEFVNKLQGDELNIGQHVILVLLLRLRQICCHPGLAEAMLYDDDIEVKGSKAIKTENNCDIEIKTENKIKKELPHENQPISSVREILSRKNSIFDFSYPSSKMLQVLKVLNEHIIGKTKDKIVIVSQWTSYLTIIENYLCTQGINVLSYTGKMTLDGRERSLNDFSFNENSAQVLLLSLTCGGVGLNLTAANHLIIMDLHWNPQMEAQAQDRIYRLGQMKPVYIYKFLCTNTIEERIKMVQDDKLKLATSVLTGVDSLKKSGGAIRFSVKELKKLFGIDDENQNIQIQASTKAKKNLTKK